MLVGNDFFLSALFGSLTFLVVILSLIVRKLRKMHRRDKIMERLAKHMRDEAIVIRMKQ